MRWGTALNLLVLAGACASSAACASDDDDDDSAARDGGGDTAFELAPALRETRCPYETDPDVTCFYLDVPESRALPHGKQIALFVERFPARNEGVDRTDAVLLLAGGPGEALGIDPGDPIRNRHDVVRIDQRGAGYSEPNLYCDEINRSQFASFDLSITDPDRAAAARDAAAACRARLVERGIDPGAYGIEASADDIEDVRRALRLMQWNLYGVSYGTRLALEVMRRHPDTVRSAVLSGMWPAQVDFWAESPSNAEQAREQFFALCDADPDCAELDPRQVYSDLIAELDAEPDRYKFELEGGAKTRVRLDAEFIADIATTGLYDTAFVPALPDLLVALKDPEVRKGLAQSIAEAGIESPRSEGAYLSVMCRDIGLMRGALPDVPAYLQSNGIELGHECEGWNAGEPSAHVRDAVQSDAPALLLVGTLDPIAPPPWSHLAAQTLPNSRVVELNGVGHDAFLQPCAQALARAFFDDPTAPPADDCDALAPPDFPTHDEP